MAKKQQNRQQGKNPCCRFCFLCEITIYLQNNQCRAYRSQTAPLSYGCTLRNFKLTGSVSNGKPSKVTVLLHEICRGSRYARYSFVTFVDIMTINGESPLLSSCHNQFFRPQTSSCGRLYMFFSCISFSITSFFYLWCSRVAVFVHPPSSQTTSPYSDRCVRRSCFVFCQSWQ